MAYSVQQSINYSQTYIQYSPLAVGTGNEPALSISNEIQNMILNAPFTWGWNRKEDSSLNTQPGIQDYTVNLTDFSFLEGVSLKDSNGVVFAVTDVYNTKTLGIGDVTTNKQARPNAACILLVTYGASIRLRFMGVPNAIYNVTLTYQKLVSPLTTLASNWTIPDQYLDVYNNLFVADAMAIVDDARSVQYRQRGVAALLSKSEGLTDMQKNLFLEQYWMRQGRSDLVGTLKAQQGVQSRGV